MGNPFFKHHVDSNDPEYRLYRGFCNEVAEMFGIDFVYLRRKFDNPDEIFGEDPANFFDTNDIMTMYIENFQQFEGAGDLFAKFGFSIEDQLILVIGVDTFYKHVNDSSRRANRDKESGDLDPLEGDLIYHPASKKFFKVDHISKPQGFYQFGAGQMMYQFTCSLFKYSHERFEFDANGMVDDIDTFMNDIGNDSESADEHAEFKAEEKDLLDFDESNVFGDK